MRSLFDDGRRRWILFWSTCVHLLQLFDMILTSLWIGKAGLFSAVLTAFIVEVFELLQPSATDPTLAVLQQISAQLNSFSVTSTFINSTQPNLSLDGTRPSFRAPQSAIWINSLWFLSLVCSLACASLALIVKQWLHEATVGLSGKSRDSARLRQYRLNGLINWRVGTIAAALPIILQVSLFLFLSGLIILLCTVDRTVAVVTTSLIAVLFAFMITVTILPVFKWECSYRSLQSFAIYVVIRFGYNTIRKALNRFIRILQESYGKMMGRADTTTPIYRFSVWFHYRVREMPTWRGRDLYTITQSKGILDRCIATTAYSTTLSTTFLDRLHIIMSDLPRSQLYPALQDIWMTCEKHWGGAFGPGHLYWYQNYRRAEFSVLYAIRHMLAVPASERDDNWNRSTKSILDKLVCDLQGPDGCSSELFISTIGPLAMDNTHLARAASSVVISHWSFAQAGTVPSAASYAMVRSGKCTILRNWASLLTRLFSARGMRLEGNALGT